ncbi:hypothetical protein ACFOWU_09735 [Epilithonimonas zeae]|uniref:RHS repeat protein n=1 Tax=Epilithonimonas zeae TaxID=1416779 RepID=A0A1N6GST9_9FLAO|nr:hypothetical protein [Epilithonimonas zeae]SIO10624.1 hypothetical protein SAMN05444409_2031 [Epilithonimonas zeae]
MKIKITICTLILCFSLMNSQFRSAADPTVQTVSNDNGTSQISYNLYTIENGNINLPINLYYSGGRGIKVNEIASWVGLGWDLSIGNISRIVQGYPDDEYKGQDNKEGILFNSVLSTIEGTNFLSASKDHVNNILKKDYEPDIFFINLSHFKTLFFFDKERKIQCLNKDVLISYNQESGGRISSFTVINQDGTKYTFGAISSVTERTNFEKGKVEIEDENEITRTYYSNWHLTNITDIFGNAVNVDYSNESISSQISKLERKNIQKPGYLTANDYDYVASTDFTKNSKLISKITASNGLIINFNVSSRSDINGGKKLDKMDINNGNLQFAFLHDYFKPASSTNSDEYRLKLNRINLNNKFYLAFTYDAKLLPNRKSKEQDFWGFYNKNNAQSLLPKIYIDESSPKSKSFVNYGYENFNENLYIKLDGADRRSNMNSEACILKTVTNKWGGSQTYNYELNDFMYDGKKVTGNGLRVSSVEYNDNNSNIYKTFYNYSKNSISTGSVINMPVFSYVNPNMGVTYMDGGKVHIEYAWAKYRYGWGVTVTGIPYPIEEHLGSSNWSSYDKYFYTTQVFAFPLNNVAGDFTVNYSQITETSTMYDGKKEYTFLAPITNNTVSDNVYFRLVGGDPYLDNNNTDFGNFPFKPSTLSNGNNTFLVNTKIFDKESKIISESNKEYIDVVKSGQITTIKSEGLRANYPLYPVYSSNPFKDSAVKITKYNILENREKVANKITETERFQDKPYENIKSLEYNSRNYIIKESWNDSEGNNYEKRIKYSSDFSAAGTPVVGSQSEALKFMNDNNILSRPIESVVFRNNKVISGELNIYKRVGNSVFLSELKTLLIDNLDISYQFSINNGSSFTQDSRYMTVQYFDIYDSRGNLLQKHTNDGIYTTQLYGYNGKYIVATLENVQYNSIPVNIVNTIQNNSEHHTLSYQLTLLRQQFPNSKIRTTMYKDFIGKLNEVDEKGITNFFQYDIMNRLIRITDVDGKILKEMKYKFAFD